MKFQILIFPLNLFKTFFTNFYLHVFFLCLQLLSLISFSIFQWNARSLYANGAEFKKIVFENNPDIICIQETFFNDRYNFSIHGYDIVKRNRSSGNGGGVAIFVKNNIPYNVEKIFDNIEALTISISSTY